MAADVVDCRDGGNFGVYRFAIAAAGQMAVVRADFVDNGLVLLCAPHGVFLLFAQSQKMGVCGGYALCVGVVSEFIYVFIVCRGDGASAAALVLAARGMVMGVYILWFLLCILGIGLCILTLITANQRMPKVQGVCLLAGVVLLVSTLGLSVYDIQTKPELDTYFMGMQVLPLAMYAWIGYFASKQLRRFKSA